MKFRTILIILVLAVITGLVIRKLFFSSDQARAVKAGGPPPAAKLSGFVVSPSASESVINTAGTLISSEEVTLRSETSGKIIQLNISEGQKVAKGTLLVKLNDDELVATQRKLESRVNLARQRLDRQKSLFESKAIAQEEYDIALNEVAVIEADMLYNEAMLRKTEIRAPFSGQVGLKSVSEGSYVTPAIEIAVMHQLNPLKLDFSIPERYSQSVRPGEEVRFTIDGSRDTFVAIVYAVEPKIDPSTRTVKMRANVSNPSGKLFPGAFARVSLVLKKTDAMLVPTQAVIPVLKGKKVFVSNAGIAVSRPIVTGERNAAMIEVLEGLQPGDTVITSGIMQLRDSMKVQIHTTN
jgi:membrane fusion protein (multidrug efflux system)